MGDSLDFARRMVRRYESEMDKPWVESSPALKAMTERGLYNWRQYVEGIEAGEPEDAIERRFI